MVLPVHFLLCNADTDTMISEKEENVMRNKGMRAKIALLAGAMLITGMLTGCAGDASGQAQGTSAQGEEAFGQTAQKGVWLEKEQTMAGIPEDVTVKQLYTVNDKVRLVTTKQESDRTRVQEWELGQEGFTEVTKEWLEALMLPGKEWLELTLMEDEQGVQYLFAGYVEEGEENYKGHLFRGEGAQAEDITPDKWQTPDEEYGGYEYITGVAALKDGTLWAGSFQSHYLLSGADGSVISCEPVSKAYGDEAATDGENIYLFSQETSGIISGVEKRTGGKPEGAQMLPVAQSGISGLDLCGVQGGTLIMAGSEGIFRMEPGGEEWEKLISGSETSFCLTTTWCIGLTALTDGRIYALFQEDGGVTRLFTYEYDPEATPAEVVTLKMYAVEETTLLQNAAAMYHREHPDVLIEVQYGYTQNDYYSRAEMDVNGIYQQLNTMLMGDGAPDILVLDHLNADSYADKGLLVDINDLIAPMEDKGELLSNITGAYRKEDGKRYLVPLQFSFTMAIGRDITGSDMASLESLAGFLSGKTESYMGPQTAGELVDKFYPFFCDRIVKDKQLDREALAKVLESLKQIADNSGIVAERGSEERAYTVWDLPWKAKLAFDEAEGFNNSMYPVAMKDYIKGDFAAFENTFIPSAEIGICTKSEHQDIAMDFIAFCLSEAVQGTDYYEGFPVNAAMLEKLAAADRSEITACTTVQVGEGAEEMFYINAYSKETAQKLTDICKELDRPVKRDEKIRDTLAECLYEYFTGNQSVDAVMDKIEGGLKMYLAE